MFTKKFITFKEWLAAHPQDTAYKRRITRQQELHPDAPLSLLRGHVQHDEQSKKIKKETDNEQQHM